MSNANNHESSKLYSTIFDYLQVSFPKTWKRIIFYTIMASESYSMKYFIDYGDGNFIDCFSAKDADQRMIRKAFMDVYQVLNKHRRQLPEKEQWSTFVFSINNEGKLKVNYGYDEIQSFHNKEVELEKQILSPSNANPVSSLVKTEAKKENTDLTGKMNDIENSLMSVKEELLKLNVNFKEIMSQTIELEKDINAYYYEDGIKKLCIISEKIKRINSDYSGIIADQLSSILINSFHVTEIIPVKGESFDPELHERINSAQIGSTIKSCLMRGWRFMDHTLVRAIVETE